jgi:hypothetical protein
VADRLVALSTKRLLRIDTIIPNRIGKPLGRSLLRNLCADVPNLAES